MKKLHTDWLSILSVTHDHPSGFLHRVYRWIIAEDQQQNIGLRIIFDPQFSLQYFPTLLVQYTVRILSSRLVSIKSTRNRPRPLFF